jgi:hypothetical protein
MLSKKLPGLEKSKECKMNKEQICKNCIYLVQPSKNRPDGICVRYPNPILKKDNDWCGEFELEEINLCVTCQHKEKKDAGDCVEQQYVFVSECELFEEKS